MQKTRIVALVTCLFTSWVVLQWFDSSRSAKHTDLVLSEFPVQLGEWKGNDTEIQDETLEVLKARSYVNRTYLNAAGQRMDVHIAIWHDSDVSECPHPPQICYPGAGWNLQDRQKATFNVDGREYPIEFMAFEKKGLRVVTGHWFQAGENFYTNADSLEERLSLFSIRRHQFDRVKVLLQSDRPSIEAAKSGLQKFAASVIESFNEQHRTKNIELLNDNEG